MTSLLGSGFSVHEQVILTVCAFFFFKKSGVNLQSYELPSPLPKRDDLTGKGANPQEMGSCCLQQNTLSYH